MVVHRLLMSLLFTHLVLRALVTCVLYGRGWVLSAVSPTLPSRRPRPARSPCGKCSGTPRALTKAFVGVPSTGLESSGPLTL